MLDTAYLDKEQDLLESKKNCSQVCYALDVWPRIEPRFGGVGPAAAALAHAVQDSSPWQSRLIAICAPGESERHRDIPDVAQVIIERGPRPLADLWLRRELRTAIAQAQVCHVHGIWLPHSLAVTQLARELSKPVVSSVHGMLEEWELANKRLKKQVYSTLFERPSLARSACLRALSEQEAKDYRAFGLKNPIAIVPNGVAALDPVDTSQLLGNFPQLNGKRIVLFMGRIHRKKGILDLLRAWPTVIRRQSDAHLLIAGSEFENTGAIARQLVSELQIASSVTFCGALNGALKIQALSAATTFCLPSYSEGMSIAVLEALSIGLPVVVTRACNVDGIEKNGAGRVISSGDPGLGTALCDSLAASGRQWKSMSDSARMLARSRYDWSRSGQAMRSVYEWLLGGGARPECVTL